ncbi:MAG TPA: rhodanese-like domain-containing protein [Noviherbaspirillum sp.]|uniref:rhodanese-like domain-containing protein n=1 Tax=Noviherbaspirillum sp. TaxID=1926288 RepID=UPI002B46E1C5|nr:rhodanese-like domain-containing protein [Noviherbaspirillum sp.]HJV85285.1 rhodanese-like domain-containing protein [Noviherbaspirillum sp.]
MNTRKFVALAAVSLALAFAGAQAFAVDAGKVPEVKRTKQALYVDAPEAYALKQKLGDKAYLVDVRTRAEVSYLGMPTVADANIPYVEHPDDAPWDDKAGRFKLEPNNDFAPELGRRLAAKGLGKDDTIILMCRSGDRSARAANLLSELGYRKVYTVVDGYEGDLAKDGPKAGQRVVNGWKNAGLPWTYQLDKNKLYFPKY